MELKNTTLDDLAAIIGFSATVRLAAWYGDRGNVYIPVVCEEGQQLVKLIGLSAAKRLTEEWPLQHLSVPRLSQYEDDLTKREISRALAHGMSTREIANQRRLSERRVQQICRELELDELIDIITPKNTGKSAGENKGGVAGGKLQGKVPPKIPPAFFGSKGKKVAA